MQVLSSTSSTSRGRQSVYGCLLLLVTAVLVFWISGGFPPPVWILLFQTCLHLDALWPGQGSSLFFPLVLLIGQAIALGGAWGLWIAVLIREGVYLQALWSEKSLAEALPADQPELYTEDSHKDGYAVAQKEENTLQIQEPSQAISTHPFNEPLDNPFEEELSSASKYPSDGLFVLEKARVEEQNGLPTDENSEQMFVFGNPFEGPLPEVFAYDKELQIMLKEVKQETKYFSPQNFQIRSQIGRQQENR